MTDPEIKFRDWLENLAIKYRVKLRYHFLPPVRTIVPTIVISYDVDTTEYVLESVYKNGLTMKEMIRSPFYSEILEFLNRM